MKADSPDVNSLEFLQHFDFGIAIVQVVVVTTIPHDEAVPPPGVDVDVFDIGSLFFGRQQSQEVLLIGFWHVIGPEFGIYFGPPSVESVALRH